MMKVLTIFLLCFFFSINLSAQESSLEGESDQWSDDIEISQETVAVDTGSKSKLKGLRFAAHYNFADTANLSAAFKVDGAVINFDQKDKVGGAFGLGVDYLYRKPFSWGFSGGLNYEFSRKYESYQFDIGSLNQSVSDGYIKELAPSFSILIAQANGNYSFADAFYGFAGLNYNLPLYADSPYSNWFEVTGGSLGYQFGFGYNVVNKLDIELGYQRLGFSYDWKAGSISVEDETYDLSGFFFKTNYHFN